MNVKCVLSLLGLCVLAGSYIPCTGAYKILAAYPFSAKSHFMMTKAIIKELDARGHQITMITAFTMAPAKLSSNYTEILIDPPYDFWSDVREVFGRDNLFELTQLDVIDFMKMMELIGLKTTEYALKHPQVKKLIDAKKTRGVYDLLLTEQFYQEAFLAFSYKYGIPVVSTSTLGYESHMSQMTGIVTPWSFVPHTFMRFTDRMTFWQRLHNSYISLYQDLYREFFYFPKMDKLVREHFSHLHLNLPAVTKMEKQVSVILLNSHAPLTTTRPTADSMIPVGGMHIYPPKPLPTNMQKFIDEAKAGVIYFSLGSNVQSKDMPPENLKVFLDTFGSLKQRVLWKFENESIADLPPNVMVKKWMPQSDILAHPNVKVFISHGGLLGTQEGTYHAVPILGMPFYCDQHLNMHKAVTAGYAISLHFQSITREVLSNALHELIENPVYKENVQRVSTIFRDRPMEPRETTVYWIEYVIRHKGAPHLHSAGIDLPWYQFYMLDVMAFVAGTVVVVVLALRALLRLVLGSGASKKPKQKQKKH